MLESVKSNKKVQALIAATLSVVVVLSMSLSSVGAQADIKAGIDAGCTAASGSACTDGSTADAETTVTNVATTIVNIFSIVVGAVAVIMLIYGGFRYITSAGNQEGVQNAKNTILYALIGLIIVIFAQTIIRFVVGAADGVVA